MPQKKPKNKPQLRIELYLTPKSKFRLFKIKKHAREIGRVFDWEDYLPLPPELLPPKLFLDLKFPLSLALPFHLRPLPLLELRSESLPPPKPALLSKLDLLSAELLLYHFCSPVSFPLGL